MPTESFVEIPLLEFLTDVVDGDELCPLHSCNTSRDELRTNFFMGEFDECTLDE
nr:hypothetical protein [Natronorubrum tibetense]